MKVYNRREVVTEILGWGVGLGVAPGLFAAAEQSLVEGKPYLVGGLIVDRKTQAPEYLKIDKQQDFFLLVIDEQVGPILKIPVPHSAHSLISHPKKPATVVAVPNGPTPNEVMEIDLTERRVTRTFAAGGGIGFYGHGLFEPHSGHFLVVEMATEGQSAISIRDPLDYKEVGRLDAKTNTPHAIFQLEGPQAGLLAVCSGSGAVILDPRAAKVLTTLPCPDAKLRFAHGHAISSGGLFVLATTAMGADRKATPGGIFHIGKELAEARRLPLPDHVIGEALSAALHDNILAVTHQDSDVVSVWDAKSDRLLKLIKSPKMPRGAAFNEQTGKFVFSSIDGLQFTLDPEAPLSISQAKVAWQGSNSSHFLRTAFKLA